MSKIVIDENVIGLSNEEEKRALNKSFSDIINNSQPRNTESKQGVPLDIIPLEDPERNSKCFKITEEALEFLKIVDYIEIPSEEEKTTLKKAADDLLEQLQAGSSASNQEVTVDILPTENLKRSSKSRLVKILVFTTVVLFVALLTSSGLSIYYKSAPRRKAEFLVNKIVWPIPYYPENLPFNCDEVTVKGRKIVTRLTSGWKVLCDTITDKGGWLIIQKRTTGWEDFYRNWYDYRSGFGSLSSDFWFGLEYVYQLTKKEYYELRVEITYQGKDYYAHYRQFRIHSEEEYYKLDVSGYSGNAGDSLCEYHNNLKFTTKDSDNDRYSGNCAVDSYGAWWYRSCHTSNLNGRWNTSMGMRWRTTTGFSSVTRSEMKIRLGALTCPAGFKLKGTVCYKFFNVFKNFDQAVHECRQLGVGAILAEPRSETENQNLIELILEQPAFGNNVWIGVTDRKTEERFRYESTGHDVIYTDWDNLAPDDFGNAQHCVEILIYNVNPRFQRYKWNDVRCNGRRMYVCQANRGKYSRT